MSTHARVKGKAKSYMVTVTTWFLFFSRKSALSYIEASRRKNLSPWCNRVTRAFPTGGAACNGTGNRSVTLVPRLRPCFPREMPAEIEYTYFPSVDKPRTWSRRRTYLQQFPRHQPIADKRAAPMFSPALYDQGASRKNDDVVSVAFGVLDLDGVQERSLIEALDFSLEFLLFTTWSHSKKGAWRVIVPYSRPLAPAEHPIVWEALVQRFGGVADRTVGDIARAYFMPSHPPGDVPRWDFNEGAVLDVDAVLRESASAPRGGPDAGAATGIATLTLDAFREAVRCQRGHMSKRFRALASGEAFAEPGERNNIAFQMMSDLAKTLPSADPESLRPFLAPSVDSMSPDDGFNLDVVVAMFTRAQSAHQGEVAETLSLDIARAWRRAGKVKTTPYTDAEVASMVGDDPALWVLQRGVSYYALLDHHYVGPIHVSEQVDTVLLSPAISAGVERYRATKNGPVAKEWPDLVLEYGTRIEQVTVDLSAQKSWFDRDSRTLYEAPCPLRPIVPHYSGEVDLWLQKFGGENYDRLVSWLASVPDVDKPTAVLFIKAPPGVGKSLLMAGLGRLWLKDPRDMPPELGDCMSQSFNQGLMKCPLAVSDEDFPANKSAHLRRFVQARSHTLRRKYLPDALVVGSPRVIIAANNRNAFRLREVLTSDDVRAVSERILYLEPSEDCIPLVKDGERWVRDDVIAAHALWLHQNHRYVKGGRFLVEGKSDSFHKSLAVSTALSSAICEWVARYLREPGKAAQVAAPVVLVEGERILVSPSGLAQYWEQYTTNFMPPPELRDVSTALQAIAYKDRVVKKVKGKATHFRELDRTFLEQWAQDNDWGDLQ